MTQHKLDKLNGWELALLTMLVREHLKDRRPTGDTTTASYLNAAALLIRLEEAAKPCLTPSS